MTSLQAKSHLKRSKRRHLLDGVDEIESPLLDNKYQDASRLSNDKEYANPVPLDGSTNGTDGEKDSIDFFNLESTNDINASMFFLFDRKANVIPKQSLVSDSDESEIYIGNINYNSVWNCCECCYDFWNFLQTLNQMLPIFNPIGPFRICWDFCVTITLFYICIAVPYTLAFGIDWTLDEWSGIVAFIIDIFLLCDIMVNFRTAFFDSFDRLQLITSPTRIAKRFVLYVYN